MTALDPDLLEQYERLRKKVLFAQLERKKGISEREKEVFFVRKLKAEIAEYMALGKERGDEKLMESIQKNAQAQIRSGVAPGKVFAQDPPEDPDQSIPALLEDPQPDEPGRIKQEPPSAEREWTFEDSTISEIDPTPRGRRAFNAPVTSGGASTMRGATSQYPLHRGLSKTLLRSRGIPAPKASIHTPLNMEHFNTKMHREADNRLLPPRTPGACHSVTGREGPIRGRRYSNSGCFGCEAGDPTRGKNKISDTTRGNLR